MLEAIGGNIWLLEGEVVDFYGFPYPTRAVVVRLDAGELWIWSPVALRDGMAEAVAALGPVAHLVSPNKIHHLYLQDWAARFPDAQLWGPLSTLRKRTDLRFETPLDDEAPPAWRGQIEQVRFHGSLFMDEVVFFHRGSRTAVLADLSENFGDGFLEQHWSPWQRAIARVWKIDARHGCAPLEWRLSWLRRAPARAALSRLLDWNPEQVVMAHGEWQRSAGRAYLERAFAWLS